MLKTCTSCNTIVTKNFTAFSCPSCGKSRITRCEKCKKSSKTYTCKHCTFTGP